MGVRVRTNRIGMIRLHRIPGELLEQVTREVYEDARRLVPVDTGALRASIDMDVDGNTGRVSAGSPRANYATYVEFGTSRMHAQPFLRPALYRKRVRG